jgi:hypothetical protein
MPDTGYRMPDEGFKDVSLFHFVVTDMTALK